MLRFIAKRTIGACIVMLLTTLFTFELIYFAPGDPAQVILLQRLGRIPDEAQTTRLAQEYGLDRPPLIQYLDWAGRAIQGDLGYSIQTGKPVTLELSSRLLPTFLLAFTTTLFAITLGVPIGFLATIKPHSVWSYLTRTLGLISVSIPDFWLAFLLILVFAVTLRWLPTHGLDSPLHLILPSLSLGSAHVAKVSRLTQSSLMEVQFQNYMRTARAKGLKEWLVWGRHALPNVVIPLLTLTVNQFSAIISGSVVIETLFALPGIGQFYVLAVRYNDIPIIQGTILLISLCFILMNLLSDIAYALIDPRIRLE
jgi:peptide/nickel transport system permease protein